MAFFDQYTDHINHALNMFRGAGLFCGVEAAQRSRVGEILVRRCFRHFADGVVQRQARKIPQCPRVDLVIDVGDVAHIFDVVRTIKMAQQPEQHVKHDGRARITDMGEVINRGAADIHAHVFRIERCEQIFLGRVSVL